jgi:hypothetical protein
MVFDRRGVKNQSFAPHANKWSSFLKTDHDYVLKLKILQEKSPDQTFRRTPAADYAVVLFFRFFRFLNLVADLLRNLFYILKALAGAGSGRLVTPFEFLVLDFQDFQFIKQFLKTHDLLL